VAKSYCSRTCESGNSSATTLGGQLSLVPLYEGPEYTLRQSYNESINN
jgi:hypothetical protein